MDAATQSSVRVRIYADGSSTGQLGPSGWAFIVLNDADEVLALDAGAETWSSNNREELRAILLGLRAVESLAEKAVVTVISDSQWALGVSGLGNQVWPKPWKSSHHRDLIDATKALVLSLGARGLWIRGHGTDHFHNVVDKLAVSARKKLQARIKAVTISQKARSK